MSNKQTQQDSSDGAREDFENVWNEGKYSPTQRKFIERRILKGLSETEWLRIKRDHSLPERARSDIQHCIASYWDFRVDHKISTKLRGEIEDAIRFVTKTRDMLVRLRTKPDFFKGLFAYYEASPLQQAASFGGAINTLQETGVLLEKALIRIKGPKHRPPHRGIWLAIGVIENIMRFNWRRRREGHEALLFDILKLADPMITTRAFKSVFDEFATVRQHWPSTREWVEQQFR